LTISTRKEFSEPVYQQIEDAYSFVLQHIHLGSRNEDMNREDIYVFPIQTIRAKS
jgi:predicted HTH transcriptional regulator